MWSQCNFHFKKLHWDQQKLLTRCYIVRFSSHTWSSTVHIMESIKNYLNLQRSNWQSTNIQSHWFSFLFQYRHLWHSCVISDIYFDHTLFLWQILNSYSNEIFDIFQCCKNIYIDDWPRAFTFHINSRSNHSSCMEMISIV